MDAMEHYFYQCFQCQEAFPAKLIEPGHHYLCPNCGKAEPNLPLQGVLRIQYDYQSLKKQLRRSNFLKLPAGKFWLYPQLWPLHFAYGKTGNTISGLPPELFDRLSLLPNSLLIFKMNHQKIMVLDDTRNPTLSYKDRASGLVALKALQIGVREIATASTGNAASSLAGICARLGLESRIFVPDTLPDAKRLQIQSYGARIFLVKGTYDAAFDLCLEVSEKKGWYNRNTAYNPLTIEGKKSGAYDIFIQTGGNLPGVIFVPVGDGVILSGIYKGFWELLQLGWIERIPRLIGVQAKGSDALARFLKVEYFQYQSPKTLADSISAGAPRNLFMAAEALRKSGGAVVTISDEQILKAQEKISREMGVLVEPAAAAAFAGYLKMRSRDSLADSTTTLLMFTGNGLKDLSAINRWVKKPRAYSPAAWRERLKD